MAREGKRNRSPFLEEALSNMNIEGEEAFKDIKISEDLDENFTYIQDIFEDCYDVQLHRFIIGTRKIGGFLAYITDLVDNNAINERILDNLVTDSRITDFDGVPRKKDLIDVVRYGLTSVGEVKEVHTIKDVVNNILLGECILFIDGNSSVLSFGVKKYEGRSVSQPVSQEVITGPMEGFNENANTSISLIRNRIKTPNLKMEKVEVGRLTKTSVIISYIKGIVKEGVVEEVKERISKIDIDGILDSGYLEELIGDNPYSPFPQIGYSERPDTCAGALLEGRVVMIVDGSPFALIVPNVFVDLLAAAEDSYNKYFFVTFIRTVRYIALAFALLLPAIYIAVITFHQEMIPTPLLLTIAGPYAGIPFPAVIEVLLLEFIFEILREAGIRLPKPVGQAVSIVGALIIGEAAVQAGLFARSTIIVAATTGLCSFTIPGYSLGRNIRVLRFIFIAFAAAFGIFGIMIVSLALLTHLSGLRSFGVPYLSPIAPLTFQDLKDTIIKLPISIMDKRPMFIQRKNLKRQNKGS